MCLEFLESLVVNGGVALGPLLLRAQTANPSGRVRAVLKMLLLPDGGRL